MLATRIIPTLLYRGSTLVKGQKFDGWRSVGHVQQAARIHAARGVDELIILDIAATPQQREPNYVLIEQIAEGNFAPLTVGGGVYSLEQAQRLLRAGADKISLCTALSTHPGLLESLARRFGCQAIVAAIDYREGTDPVRAARKAAANGAGEILITNMDREGTLTGYDLDTITKVAEAVDIPVIAHGGCSGYQDMLSAIKAGASAVAAGALFQFTDATPKGAAQYLHTHKVEVRL